MNEIMQFHRQICRQPANPESALARGTWRKGPRTWDARGWLPLAGAALVLAGLGAGCGQRAARPVQPQPVQITTVHPVNPAHHSSEPGYIGLIRAETETDLSFKVRGILEAIGPEGEPDWKEGTRLSAGDVLARLKPADFDNALAAASARTNLTEETLARLTKLRRSEAISQQELDIAKADAENAKAYLAQAEQNRKDAILRAPFDGVVAARYVNAGVTVDAGQKVLRVAKNDVMAVELGVPDRLVSRFWPGKEIDVEISAFEGEPAFPGRVSEVGVAASQEGRLFRVVIKVENRGRRIRSGMTATVRLGTLARVTPGAVLVPLSALVTAPASDAGERQLAVFVRRGGLAARVRVQTGDIIESSIIVTDGLKAGEEVVSSGASLLYEGAPIAVVTGMAAVP